MQKIFEKPKMKMIVISAASILVLTAIIITVACLNARKSADGNTATDNDDSLDAFAEHTENTTESTEDGSVQNPSKKKQLEFKSNGDGTCSVVSIGTYEEADLEIPKESPEGDTVTEISDKAFNGCSSLETVIIPATVKKIGKEVFVNCSALESITVSASNPKYASTGGVLFSKDKTVLICYPAARVGKNYLLSTNVEAISAYAFHGIQNLKTILYEGSKSKFALIDISIGNEAFEDLTVTYNYTASK